MMGRPASLGAMGIHYFRPDLLGITAPPSPRVNGAGTHTDFLKPSILIYEPQADGSLQLVAVENLVFAAAWRAAGHKEPPSFHGVKWDSMVDDPKTADRRSAHVRTALRSARVAVSRESERHVRPVQSRGQLHAPPGLEDAFRDAQASLIPIPDPNPDPNHRQVSDGRLASGALTSARALMCAIQSFGSGSARGGLDGPVFPVPT